MYKTFTEWKNGHWLEDGEPRKEAYTKDELLLVEMGWKYGFDAGKAQQADRIAELQNNTCSACGQKVTEDLIHTCSPQMKPLSDEEIIKIFNQIWNAGGNTNGVMHRFARAIEERHGIK